MDSFPKQLEHDNSFFLYFDPAEGVHLYSETFTLVGQSLPAFGIVHWINCMWRQLPILKWNVLQLFLLCLVQNNLHIESRGRVWEPREVLYSVKKGLIRAWTDCLKKKNPGLSLNCAKLALTLLCYCVSLVTSQAMLFPSAWHTRKISSESWGGEICLKPVCKFLSFLLNLHMV